MKSVLYTFIFFSVLATYTAVAESVERNVKQGTNLIVLDGSKVWARSKRDFRESPDKNSILINDNTELEIYYERKLNSGAKHLYVRILSGPHKGKMRWVYFPKANKNYHLKISQQLIPEQDVKKADTLSEATHVTVTKPTSDPKAELPLMKATRENEFIGKTAFSDFNVTTNTTALPKDTTDAQVNNALQRTSKLLSTGVKGSLNSSLQHLHGRDCQDKGSLEHNDCKIGVNDYLDGRLEHVSPSPPVNLTNPKSQLPLECIKAGMTGFDTLNNSNYAVCNDSTSKPSFYITDPKNPGHPRETEKPCASNKLAFKVHTSFTHIADCYGIDAKTMVPLMMAESGFHVNAVSPSNCAGPFQLCGGKATIKDVNQRFYTKMMSRFKDSKKASCHWIAKSVETPMNHRSSKSCERIGQKVNGKWVYDPTRNLVYGTESFKQNLMTTKTRLGLTKRFRGLPPEEQSKISNTIALWANNTGPGIISFAQKIFMRHKYTSYSNFISTLKRRLKTSFPGDSKRKLEVSNFINLMSSGVKSLNKNLPDHVNPKDCGWSVK